MADASSDWAGRPLSDQAFSSDEEDFVSSQSTASADRESRTQRSLSSTLGRLHLDNENTSGDHSATRTLTPDANASVLDHSKVKPDRKKLELLDLPLDVLKIIVKEVTHTNDLTSLALTCSALHTLTISHMYARFDIIWPESLNSSSADEYPGVDALSYGLSTLVMGEDVFHQVPMPRPSQSQHACAHCGCGEHAQRPAGDQTPTVIPGFGLRRGNYYAQYTRTFSIGNGPLSWIREYSVNREVGKMLGTLVALAVARMVNLEAFIWDMPTGVVREIWLALASLANRPGYECRLERVWVRWHDNSEHSMRPNTMLLTSFLTTLKNTHIEHPSLSVLPPLKSVTVLDIDEPTYVDELGTLIERSRHRLTELRIGISSKASMLLWVRCAKPTDLSITPAKPWPKIGGVLSILSKRDESEHEDASTSSFTEESVPLEPSTYPSTMDNSKKGESEVPQDTNPSHGEQQQSSVPTTESGPLSSACVPQSTSKTRAPYYGSQLNTDKLNLEILELERVPLHVPTLLPNIEWTRLTTLTLMACTDHENLWRALRRKYAPPPVPANKQKGDRRSSHEGMEYSLNLKHLRTDNVSAYLMLFIKEAIAPNTLESVYLQEAPGYDSSVPIDAIYKHILRRHRLSLRKVLIDASERLSTGSDAMAHRWHKWVLNQDMISFVTGGRMPQLRELGMAMDHRNWHHFLQRLPNMSRLYALNLTHIGNAVHLNLKELALQVLDIVSIRPDMKLTYIGLQARCYQILEGGRDGSEPVIDYTRGVDRPSDLDDDGEEDDSMGDEHDPSMHDDSDRLSGGFSDGYDTEQEDEGVSRVRFRLQEILFYDDKISIFKARHGVI